MGNITKLALILLVISLIMNSWQAFSNYRLETSLSNERVKVESLEKDITRLKDNLLTSKTICESERKALNERLDKEIKIRESVSKAKDSLQKLRGNSCEIKKDTENTIDTDSYNRDIARVLNDACREIYGQDCPSPN